MIASQAPVDLRRLVALAQAGHSQRWIARRLGLKPTFVRQRLNELLRADRIPAEPANAAEITLPAGDLLPDDDTPPGYDPANIRRCPSCGALVYLWPCLACHMAAEASPQFTQP